jgi:hypothetical protein
VASKHAPARPRNRRGSPEAVAKRCAGRAFNLLLEARQSRRPLDGRSLKRRQRLLQELRTGKRRGSQQPLKPLDVLARVNELLELGESPTAIRKVHRPRPPHAEQLDLVHAVSELHQAYGFRLQAYRLLGISDQVLRQAGVLPSSTESN